MIALIDYDIGNLHSVSKAIEKAGARVLRARKPADLEPAWGAVLPGVGAFGDCIKALAASGFEEAVKNFIASGRPFLGICVGHQMLFEASFENGTHRGLGIFKGPVERFKDTPGLKIPQIGWNQVRQARPDCPLFRGIPDLSYFYFVHSYAVRPKEKDIIAGTTDYGETFASVVWRNNVFATQFHQIGRAHV